MAQTPVTQLMAVGRLIRSRMEKALPNSFAQCEVLRVVAEMKRPTMRDIAMHFKIAAPSATALVEQLVQERFLERKQDPSDRRQVRIALTARGRKAYERITEKREAVIKSILSVLNESDISDLTRVLTTIITKA